MVKLIFQADKDFATDHTQAGVTQSPEVHSLEAKTRIDLQLGVIEEKTHSTEVSPPETAGRPEQDQVGIELNAKGFQDERQGSQCRHAQAVVPHCPTTHRIRRNRNRRRPCGDPESG